jgi:uncharacterized protein YgbK (DUF1537 family)
VASLEYREVLQGGIHLGRRIAALATEGHRVSICDGITGDDSAEVAAGAVLSGVPFIAVDPGPFTAAVAKRLSDPKETASILVAVGSVNAVARAQVERFLAARNPHNVFLDTARIAEGGTVAEEEMSRAAGEILGGDRGLSSLICRSIYPEHRVDLAALAKSQGRSPQVLSEAITGSVAEIVRRALAAEPRFRGLYTCGGDVTVAVCRALGGRAIALEDEVVPLGSYGTLRGGQWAGLHLVTKGGMVGGEEAIVASVDYIRRKIDYE